MWEIDLQSRDLQQAPQYRASSVCDGKPQRALLRPVLEIDIQCRAFQKQLQYIIRCVFESSHHWGFPLGECINVGPALQEGLGKVPIVAHSREAE